MQRNSVGRISNRAVGMVAILALGVASACGSNGDSDEGSGAQPDVSATLAPVDDGVPATTVVETSMVTVVGDPLQPFVDAASDPLGVAPVVSGQSFDGTDVTIGGASSGPTMLVFLAHWCPHCNAEIPELNSLRDSGDIPDDVDVIGISTGVASDRDNYPPSAWIVEKGWTWPVLADSEDSLAIQAFGGTGFPFTVMLDASGNVLGRRSGSGSAAEIKNWIDSVVPS